MVDCGRGRSKRQRYDDSASGERGEAPLLPRLRSDPPIDSPIPHSLAEFRAHEGRAVRKARLQALWKQLPTPEPRGIEPNTSTSTKDTALTPERASQLKLLYEQELLGNCGGSTIGWRAFKEYAEAKEVELWRIFHDELDLDRDGLIDAQELKQALGKAGVQIPPAKLQEFMASLTSTPHPLSIDFSSFRDFLLLLPRKVDTLEIYRWYQVNKYLGEDGRGTARVNMEGDVSLSAEDKPPAPPPVYLKLVGGQPLPRQHVEKPAESSHQEEEEDEHSWWEGNTALRFLAAGGIAGAVSRTCTAPFDRLKIFLITRPPDLGGSALSPRPSVQGIKHVANAVVRIYAEGGAHAFWTGNGLSVAKIFPESAIKFFTYESSKRAFAKHWDKVEDSRDISGFSRFMSGGVGGLTSQLSIYPIETLKTQKMSSTGEHKRTLIQAAKHVWALGGVRAYYRGLTIGLVGVFPYSAIDMSTFEALKLAYLKSTNKEEPGVLALLAFGSISGSVGATSVYPLNLVRTRLQASGSSGHPQTYTGVWDVAAKTLERDGWRGFYRGLGPTLAKVVPAVSISYVVYEYSKRKLGV